MFQARFSAAVAGGEAASVRAEHTDKHQIAWAKLRQEAAHDRTVLRTDGQQLHQRPPSGGIRNVHRMVCAAFDQARTLRRIDIQHGKRSRPRLDSPYPRDQRSAGCGEEPSGTHLQREAAQRFRKGLYLRQDGFGARIRLRTGKAGPVADAKTAAKVNCIYRGVGFLIQRLCQRGKLGEDSGIEVLVHAQLAQPHTEAKPASAVRRSASRSIPA